MNRNRLTPCESMPFRSAFHQQIGVDQRLFRPACRLSRTSRRRTSSGLRLYKNCLFHSSRSLFRSVLMDSWRLLEEYPAALRFPRLLLCVCLADLVCHQPVTRLRAAFEFERHWFGCHVHPRPLFQLRNQRLGDIHLLQVKRSGNIISRRSLPQSAPGSRSPSGWFPFRSENAAG